VGRFITSVVTQKATESDDAGLELTLEAQKAAGQSARRKRKSSGQVPFRVEHSLPWLRAHHPMRQVWAKTSHHCGGRKSRFAASASYFPAEALKKAFDRTLSAILGSISSLKDFAELNN